MAENSIPPTQTGLPAHEQVYRRARALLLFGELPPGTPVTIQGLIDLLGVGMTPARETIRRLCAEGALMFQDNRRVSVPELHASAIDELFYARVSIEAELMRRACACAMPQNIEALRAIDSDLDQAIARGDVRGYLELNYRFHSYLYDLSDAPILRGIAEGLWLRFGPSLRVICGRYGTQSLPDQHKAILIAMEAGNVLAAVEAIKGDIRQGIEQIQQTLA